ncbi:MAG: HAD-IB family hydrolase [Pseudomonadota bacterium]
MARTNIEDLIEDIYDSGEGPEIAAFFDFDRTLISGFSAKAFMQEQLRERRLPAKAIASTLASIAKYSAGRTNFSGFMAETTKHLAGETEADLDEVGEKIFREKLVAAIYPEARALLEAHREMGHTIAIVSSATKFQIEAAARELGIEYILCTDVEIEDGVLTGRVLSPTCFGKGKRTAAEDFSEDFGLDMNQSFFYTDSEDDLPLLDVVGRPRVVNPSKALAKIARARTWKVCNFRDREKVKMLDLARAGSVYAMMPTSFALSSPLWAVTRKKRPLLNVSTTIWAEAASALVGLEYDIEGEEHIWSHRPAIFIFNHQSSIDTVIIAKLLRRDFTGIGKKELKHFPIVGQAMQLSDVVFLDRSSPAKAIEAMRQAGETMIEKGLSLCLAPEGTRSVGRALGPFKKGAFHLALQTKRPIVPIVIHNAADSQPSGNNIARPAKIRVTVLPPIPTKTWRLRSLNTKIAEVRQLYLDTLGQVDSQSA